LPLHKSGNGRSQIAPSLPVRQYTRFVVAAIRDRDPQVGDRAAELSVSTSIGYLIACEPRKERAATEKFRQAFPFKHGRRRCFHLHPRDNSIPSPRNQSMLDGFRGQKLSSL
jgi:hypothetical protein